MNGLANFHRKIVIKRRYFVIEWFLLVILFNLISFSSAQAEWLQVTGKASLAHGRYELAREQAMEDALRQAVYQYGVSIESQQSIQNGQFKDENFQISSRGQIKQSVIQSESEADGFLLLTVNVDVVDLPLCEDSQGSLYKKEVAVLGFALQSPDQANIGGLQSIDRGFASMLAQQLQKTEAVVVFEQSQVGMHKDLRNAPSHYTEQLTLTHVVDYAKQAGVQFVVSGVIRDLGFEDPESFSNDYWTKLKRLAKKSNLNRRFVVDVFVHDGFSGSIVWQKQFEVTGLWQADLTEKVGFETPAFLQTDYGQKVVKLTQTLTRNILEQVHCQPFMVRITRVEGKTLHFASGASSAIRPGDTFGVYRTANFYDSDRLMGVELENVKVALTVTQVHPDFASGTISVDPGRLNIQTDDVLVAW